ncbi:MAG: hypothetical protein ACEQSK_20505 [Sphingomonadaceae bacterium]
MKSVLFALCLAVPTLASADPFEAAPPVPDSELAQTRGGFATANGLLVSLGIERLVSINGAVVASSNFSMSDVAQASAADLQLASEAVATVTLVQNGAGNVYQQDGLLPGLGTLLIQNSVNDQLIRSQTTISTTVNSLSLLKDLNFASSLRDALNRAVGPN